MAKRSSRQRAHDAASSSRVPRRRKRAAGLPCRPLRPERTKTVRKMAQADHNGRRAHGSCKKPKSTGADRRPMEAIVVCVPAEDCCCHWTMSWAACETRSLTSGRSALHRCSCTATASPGCRSRRPKSSANAFKTYEIGYVHIDSCRELRHRRRQASSCSSPYRPGFQVHLRRVPRQRGRSGQDRGARPSSATPCKVSSPIRSTPCSQTMAWQSTLPTCSKKPGRPQPPLSGTPHLRPSPHEEWQDEHRLTKPYHPWTNGQAERMNRQCDQGRLQSRSSTTTICNAG